MLKEKACGKLLHQVIIKCILSISAPVSVPNCWWQQLLPLCSLWKSILQMVVPGCLEKKKKKSHSFINGSNPFSPTLYIVDLWTANFTGIFFRNTETDVSVLVRTFQGKMKTHWKHSISPATANCSKTSEICLSFSVWSLWNKNCSYGALQVETPASTKQHFEACAHHLHISLQGQPDMFSPANQKYINVSLFLFSWCHPT